MAISGGNPLAEFTTLAASQGPAWASGPEQLVNEAQRRNYTLARCLKYKSIYDYVQSGTTITDTIFFNVKTTTQRYNPGAHVDRSNPQTGESWSIDWAFLHAHMSWNKQEIGLNKDSTTAKYRSQKYKSVLYQKHQNLKTDIHATIEDEFWAVPDNATMEAAPTGATAKVPYSIPVFCNEYENSLFAGFTNVMGIAPATQTKWQNGGRPYTFATTTALTAAGLFAPMSSLVRSMRFEALPMDKEYGTKTDTPHVIFASDQGLVNYEYALRVNQDTFRGMGKMSGQDPHYDGPTFRGIPMEYIETKDTAAIYPTGASDALSTELDATNDQGSAAVSVDGVTELGHAGPRYEFANLEYACWCTHSENFFVMEDPIKLQGQVGTWAQDFDLWNNFYVRSRRRAFGILFPGDDTTDA